MDKVISVQGEITEKIEKQNKKGEPFYKYSIEFGDKRNTINSAEGKFKIGDKVAWMVRESSYDYQGQETTSRWYVQDASLQDGELPTSLEDTVYQMYEDTKEIKEMLKKLTTPEGSYDDEQNKIDDAIARDEATGGTDDSEHIQV